MPKKPPPPLVEVEKRLQGLEKQVASIQKDVELLKQAVMASRRPRFINAKKR